MNERSDEYDRLVPYLEAVRRSGTLTREEEHVLAVRARGGDALAAQELVRHNLAFVVSIARRQARGTVRLEDIIQEGNLGLLRAVQKFDPFVGTRFTTYAVWWIRAYIGRYLKEARSAVRPHGGSVAQTDMSLDAAIDEEGGTTYVERLEDARPAPDDEYARQEHDGQLRDALAKVRRRVGGMGWDIVHERLAADPPQCLEEIGKRWGVSRERVRQVELTTKQFLARYLDAHRLATASPRPSVSVVAPAAPHVRARRVTGRSAPDVRTRHPARRAKARRHSLAPQATTAGERFRGSAAGSR